MSLQTFTAQTPLAWTTIGPLASREGWLVKEGILQVSTEPVVDDKQGMTLYHGDRFDFRAGLTIYVRALSPNAQVSREAAMAQEYTPADMLVTGPAGLSALNTGLLTGLINGIMDVSQYSAVTVQINGSAGISAGAVTFEQSVDGVNFMPLIVSEITTINANPVIAAITIAANANRLFLVMPTVPYMRVRISTAFAGGTIQAFAHLRQRTVDFPVVNVQQASGANLNVSALPGVATAAILNSAATVNNTLVKASAGNLLSGTFFNQSAATKYIKFFNKATAPTVGTDIPVIIIPVPAGGMALYNPGLNGQRMSSGIAYAITGGAALLDATAVAAGDVQLALTYN